MVLSKYLIAVILIFTLPAMMTCDQISDRTGGVVQEPPENPLDPFQQNEVLGSGINMGNALEAPAEGEWGMTIREEYFQLISDAGFDAVRIPIRWNAHASDNPPYTIEPDFFDRVDQVLQQSLERHLAAIINIHHYNALMDNPAEHKERFLQIWRQIAEHYYDYPYTLFFEILNEPHGEFNAPLWNEYLREAISVVRESNPYRTLIIGTYPWGGIDGLRNLTIPNEERNIIVTVHYYEPFQFTHQGAEWVGQDSEQWLGTTWTGTESEKQEVDEDFNFVKDWAKDHNRPIYLGEFGAYSEAPMESRETWTTYIRSRAEELSFSWAYWEFGAGFGVYDRDNHQWRTPLLRALLPDSPGLKP